MAEYAELMNDEQEEIIYHPIVLALMNGGEIESVTIDAEWVDDHCPCLNATVTVNGETHQYVDNWLSSNGLKMYHHAECGCGIGLAAKQKLALHIKEFHFDN